MHFDFEGALMRRGCTKTDVIRARGRLANAKTWFAHRGWDVLPDNERGRRILQWGADHAWLAGPANPKRSVRSWCLRWAPWLTDAELNQLVRETEARDKRWTNDQSATVLEIGVRDREALRLWFFGADDDPNYQRRQELKRAKDAARKRKSRVAHNTGRPRGRPPLDLSPEELAARKREQAAERQRRRRASRKNKSRDIIDIGSVTNLSVTPTAKVSAERPSATARMTPDDVIEVADAELLSEIKIAIPRKPDVIVLVQLPKAGRAQARRPIHAGMLEKWRERRATFGGQQ
ncbi:hypothetical protein [Bradyrhizobium australiense]|uniref:Uncharacterized protein n=1 Tax=Bradyrhizobium australiense TaxID=2721161 RepID=A0A7Y4LY98_9BRAD|nr:hypothetical protein [Bradyrhizobium australiense]NOJ43303.1 hypothetical protein [Bradyrhizobium australiense]